MVKSNGGNAAGLNANICVCLYLSPCELGMNNTGDMLTMSIWSKTNTNTTIQDLKVRVGE